MNNPKSQPCRHWRKLYHLLKEEQALVDQVREIETQVDAGTPAVASEQLRCLRTRIHNHFGNLQTALGV